MAWDIEDVVQRFINAASLADRVISREAFRVERWPAPHNPRGLPTGWMAVYIFVHGERALKIGKAGPQSNARYQSQHYRAASSNSNLSKSLIGSGDKIGAAGLTAENAGEWIRQNTERVNFLLPAALGVPVLTLLESFLQCYLKPVFEGFESQRAT